MGPIRPVRSAPGRARPGGRADDRRVAATSLGLAGAFLALAVAAAAGPVLAGGTPVPWLPLHLALAGGATTAIAGMLPFFVAALAAAPPADPRLRLAGVLLVASGALLVAARAVLPAVPAAPVAGGVLFLAGIAATAAAARQAARRGPAARFPVVGRAYGLALANVALGALLGTLLVAGWPPVLEAWGRLRPAHAWTNVVGFVSLVIAGTLLHLLPTALGGRIVPRTAGGVAVAGIGLGTPLATTGLVLAAPGPYAAGLSAVAAGTLALVVQVALAVRARGRWTGERGWHLVAAGGLLAGTAWFAAGIALAVAAGLRAGPGRGAWDTRLAGAPLVAGWTVQVLVAAWTHVAPAVGRGGPRAHAARRAVLGRLAVPRLAALNLGTALLAAGWPAGVPAATAAGLALVLAGAGTSAALLLAALHLPAPPDGPASAPAGQPGPPR